MEKLYDEEFKEKIRETIDNKLKKSRRRSLSIILTTLFLMTLGLFNILSIAFYARGIFSVKKYILYLVLGAVGFLFFTKFNYKYFYKKKFKLSILIISIMLLLLMGFGNKFFPNLVKEINGATGWLNLKFISVQPAEILKIAYIILLASTITKGEERNLDSSKIIINLSIVFFIFSGLIYFQNDLGTIIHYFLIFIVFIFFTEIKIKTIVKLMVLFTIISTGVMTFIYNSEFGSANYRILRIKMFIEGLIKDNYIGNTGIGYQVSQSLLAFGNGGFLGRSYGSGVQKYNYLPEIHTDFIMALFGEENGFIGLIIVLLLFFLLFNLIINVGINTSDKFGKYLVIGIGGYIIIQFFINFFVAVGMLPVFGIPMPIFSYGGSSLLTILSSIGIVVNVNKNRQFDKK